MDTITVYMQNKQPGRLRSSEAVYINSTLLYTIVNSFSLIILHKSDVMHASHHVCAAVGTFGRSSVCFGCPRFVCN